MKKFSTISKSKQHRQLHRRLGTGREGTTAVEFALVSPLFFVLIFAAIEFSMVGTIRSTANNAAYDAARLLVVPGADAQSGIAEAERIMGAVGVSKLTVAVTPATIDADTESVSVEVSVPYADNAILTPWFVGDRTFVSTCSLKTERYGGVAAP